MARVSVHTDKDNSLVRLGAVVRARRTAIGLSQAALVDSAAIDRVDIGKIERGERSVIF